MPEIACSKGCFVCGGHETGIHDGGCCASTRCNSRMWDRQVKKWLDAEKKWKANGKAMITRWLIAEQLYKVQVESWLAAEQQHRVTVEDWLVAEQLYNEQDRENRLMAMVRAERQAEQPVRPPRKVNRVNVPAKPRTPVTSATKMTAVAMHGVS
jgi:hypothetical protein